MLAVIYVKMSYKSKKHVVGWSKKENKSGHWFGECLRGRVAGNAMHVMNIITR